MLTTVAAIDALLWLAVGYATATWTPQLVVLLAPTASALFMVIACSLGVYAARGSVSWPLVCAVLVGGPAAAAITLQRCGPRR